MFDEHLLNNLESHIYRLLLNITSHVVPPGTSFVYKRIAPDGILSSKCFNIVNHPIIPFIQSNIKIKLQRTHSPEDTPNNHDVLSSFTVNLVTGASSTSDQRSSSGLKAILLFFFELPSRPVTQPRKQLHPNALWCCIPNNETAVQSRTTEELQNDQ
ncbi:hypothetical protein Tco_0044484 [Tanacetum coccineum]